MVKEFDILIREYDNNEICIKDFIRKIKKSNDKDKESYECKISGLKARQRVIEKVLNK